eukprot:scaffold8514_cov74-Skeletonema_dohrnii-CCMP3373.AAC.10
MSTIDSIIQYRGGLYMGAAFDNEPHGFGFYSLPGGKRYSPIWFIGDFRYGQEHGFGTMFYPNDGSCYTGLYSQGKAQRDTVLSSTEINTHLQSHIIHISHVLNGVKEDLDDARTTTEQVGSSLSNWQTKFDILCNLAQMSGVDQAILNNVRNERDSRTLFNLAQASAIDHNSTFNNIMMEHENEH